MTWLQVLTLAFTILMGIVGAGWAIFRPLIQRLIETMVVQPIAELRAEIQKIHSEYGGRLHELEIWKARLEGRLSGCRCPAVDQENNKSCRE